ncbi:MAG: MFS transporter [Gemmatales bacterium]|nr:MFS transporter [Gemmatales bacterium]MDW8224320.1 MFS transporter [Gemmatales bacterium]
MKNEPTSSVADSRHISAAAWWTLILNTTAFTICFAVWMMNGVLMTFLVDNGLYDWDPAALGWLMGIPVLTGSIMRLPMGLLTDRFGGKWVFGLLLLGSAIPTYLVSVCDSFTEFFLASLGFGMTGTGFAVGVAFTSVWFPRERQGLALGIFGAGNAGAAVTSLLAPVLLRWLTDGGENLEGWRILPRIYAAALVLMGIAFLLCARNRLAPGAGSKTLRQQLRPLVNLRVWRFGLYYFYVFGGFVALAQWLIPYYVNVYAMSVVMAGLMASIFSLPSGLIRAVGGWLSDLFGARTVMYWVFGVSLVCFLLLLFPQMDIHSPGSGVMARSAGTVVAVDSARIVLRSKIGKEEVYPYQPKTGELVTEQQRRSGWLILPRSMTWQEPVIAVGDEVQKRQLLARGVTHIFFQANVWIFTALVFVIGVVTGIGKAAVYRYIPDYFPTEVGVVGGIVGVLGGLGGFVCPIIFGYLLRGTGIWTSCWLFFLILTAVCTLWLHLVVRSILKQQSPEQLHRIELHPET